MAEPIGKSTPQTRSQPEASPRDGWGGYANIAAAALDRKHHFWLGASPRLFFANTANGYRHDRWFIITGDVAFRF